MISGFRNTGIFFPVIKRIDFFCTDACCFHETVRRSPKITFIRLIYKSGPVGNYQCTSIFSKGTKLFGVSVIEHIGHRYCYQLIIRQVMFHTDNIGIITFSSKCTILFLYVFLVMHIFISRSLGIFQRPVIFTVIKNSHRRLRYTSHSFLDLFQNFSYLCHFTKNSGIITAIVIDHRTVEFLGGTLTLAELEIQDTVGTMGDCLQGSSQMHSRFFQLIDRLPVGCRRTGFHQKERCFFDTPHKVVLQGSIHCCGIVVFFMPAWVIIPGSDIHNILKLFIVKSVVVVHQIGGCRKI